MTVRLLVLFCLLFVAGCGEDAVPRSPYVQHNLVVLRTVPAISDARLVRTNSEPQRNGDGEGRIEAYRTTRVYDLAPGTTAADALRFYREHLVRHGWRVVTGGADHLNMDEGTRPSRFSRDEAVCTSEPITTVGCASRRPDLDEPLAPDERSQRIRRS